MSRKKRTSEYAAVPASVQQTIPINKVYADGIFELPGSLFSMTYSFTDINYAVASKENKQAMFFQWSDVLNMLDSNSTASLQIRNDKYYAVLNFKDGNGKRRQKWVCSDIPAKGNRKKAQEFLRITIEEYDKADLEYADMPVWKYFTFWLETQENVVAKCTYRTYKGNMENHIIPYFREKGIKLHALKPFHLEDYYRAMMSTRKKDGSTMSPTTIQHHHQNISKALNDAVRREYIPFNPATSARTPKTKKYIGTFLNPSQIMEMLALFEGTPIEHPIQLISTYGLRRSEALGLSWQYVDFENEQFTIARTVIQNVGENYIKDNAKNDTSYRTLPMTPSIKEMLLATTLPF